MSPVRIAVVSGAAPTPDETLVAAARLAARLDGELAAVFVQELDLLQWAALPFTREVGLATATPRDVDASAMARAMRAAGQRLQARVAAAATRARVSWSFRVARGSFAGALAATEGELVLSAADASPAPAPRLTAICRAAGALEALAGLHGLAPAELDLVLVGGLDGDGAEDLHRRLRRAAPRVSVRHARRDEDLPALLAGRNE